MRSCITAFVFIINLIFDVFQYIQPFNFPITNSLCLWKSCKSSIILIKFVTYYSQYSANIIGSGLVFEAGGVVGATPQKCKVHEWHACTAALQKPFRLFDFWTIKIKILKTRFIWWIFKIGINMNNRGVVGATPEDMGHHTL